MFKTMNPALLLKHYRNSPSFPDNMFGVSAAEQKPAGAPIMSEGLQRKMEDSLQSIVPQESFKCPCRDHEPVQRMANDKIETFNAKTDSVKINLIACIIIVLLVLYCVYTYIKLEVLKFKYEFLMRNTIER